MSENTGLKRILLLDDDADFRKLLLLYLRKIFDGIEIDEYDPVARGVPGEDFDWSKYDVLLLDYYLCIHNVTGLDILQAHRKNHLFPATIMLTGAGNEEIAVRALKAGVYDYLRKERLDKDRLRRSILDAVEKHKLERQRQNELTNQSHAFNKALFYQELEQGQEEATAKNRILVLVRLDDHKAVEERLGIIMRDNIVRHLAKQSFDVFQLGRCNPHITRLSDDCVALIIDDPGLASTLEFNMQGLCTHLKKHPYKFDEKKFRFRVSIGVALVPREGRSADRLIHRARRACEIAAGQPENSYHIYSPADEPAAAEEAGGAPIPAGAIPEETWVPAPTPEVTAEVAALTVAESVALPEAAVTVEAPEWEAFIAEPETAPLAPPSSLFPVNESVDRPAPVFPPAATIEAAGPSALPGTAPISKPEAETPRLESALELPVERAPAAPSTEIAAAAGAITAPVVASIAAEQTGGVAPPSAPGAIPPATLEPVPSATSEPAPVAPDASTAAAIPLQTAVETEEVIGAMAAETPGPEFAPLDMAAPAPESIPAPGWILPLAEPFQAMNAAAPPEPVAPSRMEAPPQRETAIFPVSRAATADLEPIELPREEPAGAVTDYALPATPRPGPVEPPAAPAPPIAEMTKPAPDTGFTLTVEPAAERAPAPPIRAEPAMPKPVPATGRSAAPGVPPAAKPESIPPAPRKPAVPAPRRAAAEPRKPALTPQAAGTTAPDVAKPVLVKTPPPMAPAPAGKTAPPAAQPRAPAPAKPAAAAKPERAERDEADLDDVKLDPAAQKIKKAFDEKRVVQTFQPVISLVNVEGADEREVYKVRLQLIDREGGLVDEEQIYNDAAIPAFRKFIDRWLLRETIGRLVNAPQDDYVFLLRISDASLADPALFNWLRKLLVGLHKRQPGRCIALEVAAGDYSGQQKKVKALFDYLNKSHGFHFVLSRVDDINQVQPLTGSRQFDLIKISYARLAELQGLPAGAADSGTVLDRIKAGGMRVIVEDVEDANTLTSVISAGADYAMGNFIGEPISRLGDTTNVESFEII